MDFFDDEQEWGPGLPLAVEQGGDDRGDEFAGVVSVVFGHVEDDGDVFDECEFCQRVGVLGADLAVAFGTRADDEQVV